MKKEWAVKKHQRLLELNLENKQFLLAISGGADSMLMLDLFITLRVNYNISFSVAHLNHNLRAESSYEQSQLEKIFTKNQIAFVTDSLDVKAYQKKKKISLEMAAHELRYQFFEDARKKLKADIICTAHHQDDHIESILMNIFRGSGLEGLKGLNEFDGIYFKPLLNLKKSDILKYLKNSDFKYFEDLSNSDTSIERNFWRHEVISKLNSYYGESFAKGLLKTIENLHWSQEDLKLFQRKFDEHLEQRTNDGKLLLELTVLKEYLSPFLKSLLDRLISYELKQDVKLSQSDFKQIVHLIHRSESGKYIDLMKHLRVEKSFDKLIIHAKEPDLIELDVDKDQRYKIRNSYFEIKSINSVADKDDSSEIISGDNLEFPLQIKNVDLNENFQPLGLKGKQKMNRFLKSNKIYNSDRKQVVALYNQDEIVSVLGLRISENYKITDQTKAKYKIIYKDI